MRLACCQLNVAFNDPAANARKVVETLESLKTKGVEFAVFPEAFLTGYCVECQTDAQEISMTRDDPALQKIREAVERTDITTIVGFAENRDNGLYNTAVLMEKGE